MAPKRVPKKVNYSPALATWKGFIAWLKEQKDEKKVYGCMKYELTHQNRAQFLDRARTRFNKLRSYRELKDLEKLSGKVINVNYMKEGE